MARSSRTGDTATSCTEWCARCRAHALGLGGGPYTPQQLQQLVVEPVPAQKDPDVVMAEVARDEARAVFDALDAVWQSALAAKTRADLYGEGDPADRRRLNEAEAQAREARDRAWRPVVAANTRLHAATRNAAALAEAG
jgi:hypothetical protein